MAHFAILDENNVVTNVVRIGDDDIIDEHGEECEHLGQCFCKKLFNDEEIRAVKTSYNGKFRKKFAGVGDTYLEKHDVFISPQPYPSSTLNMETFDWDCPVPKPENPPKNQIYIWNEENLNWELRSTLLPVLEISNEMFRSQLTLEEKLMWDNPEIGSATKKPFIVTVKMNFPINLHRDQPNESLELLVNTSVFSRERMNDIIEGLLTPVAPPIPEIE